MTMISMQDATNRLQGMLKQIITNLQQKHNPQWQELTNSTRNQAYPLEKFTPLLDTIEAKLIGESHIAYVIDQLSNIGFFQHNKEKDYAYTYLSACLKGRKDISRESIPAKPQRNNQGHSTTGRLNDAIVSNLTDSKIRLSGKLSGQGLVGAGGTPQSSADNSCYNPMHGKVAEADINDSALPNGDTTTIKERIPSLSVIIRGLFAESTRNDSDGLTTPLLSNDK